MIETPEADDPRTPARLALRLLWTARADDAVLFDAPRLRLHADGPVLDELAAAEALLSIDLPVHLAAVPRGEVLEITAVYPDPPLPAEDFSAGAEVRDPDAPTILAWTAGRALLVSRRALAKSAADYRVFGAGWAAGYDRPHLGPDVAETLGVEMAALEEVEWLLLAGRTRAAGGRPGVPVRRGPRT
ncbi:MAG TPA: hypothetical protein VFQ39_11600 [Longimicrobium sp.]|nr:hypothetical protein [Longimicrobium sp.]